MSDKILNQNDFTTRAGADFGHPLMETRDRVEVDQTDAAKTFLTEDLPDYIKRVSALAARPEAAEFFTWLKENAKDEDNMLFRLLHHEVA